MPFPFATVEDLGKRWKAMPSGDRETIQIALEDASQFILDMVPSASKAEPATLKRIVCSVVRRSLDADADLVGVESVQTGAGPYQETLKPLNPHGDFYLTKSEKQALGVGRQKAFSIDLMPNVEPEKPWWIL